nr:hypothetical protein [Tanacetum cinerariifolium]
MFEREKLSGLNSNDWFCSPKLVLRVEKKLSVIEQPIPPAPPIDSTTQLLAQWNVVYDAHNEVAYLMLGSMTPELYRQQEEGKSVSSYVLKMKGYVEQLEHLGYVLPQDLSVGLIMNGLTSDFVGFLRNYNMHNIGKTIGELHALFIEYKKGLPKKAATPQVMTIQGSRIQKANKKSLKWKGKGKGKGKNKHGYIPKPKNPKPSAKEHPTKDDACHHCKEVGHWKMNCHAYLAELIKKKKQVGTSNNFHYAPTITKDYALEFATCIFNMVPTKKVDKTPYELWYGKVPNFSYLKVWGCEALVKRNMPDKLQQRSIKCIFIGYPKEMMGYYFYFPPENKIVVASEIPMEVKGFEPPQEGVIPVRRFARTHRAPNRLCLNIEAEEHCLGDLYEPTNYKVAILDLKSDKRLDAMNVKMQSMKGNQVWCLVDLSSNGKTVGSKWLFKKETDMDGILHTYKARLVAKGFTQTYGVDYEETFSPIADIRAIRIIIAIVAFYDYEIWQMDVKTAFLNGYLDEDIYMNPGEPHWTAVKTILKCLRNTKEMFLVYGTNHEAELRVDCYCDAGFKTNRDDIKSQTRYIFILNGGAVDWKSSKQSTTAMSATKAEYIVASEAAMEVVWIRKFISGLCIAPTINEPIKMFCDNSAALLIANEPGVQRGTRHYHKRYHYVRECIELA